MEKNIIIGAGISGLSCGNILKNECIVLEKESSIGGLAKTEEFNGFRFDLGGHRFLSQNEQVGKFVQSIVGKEIFVIARRSKIYRGKKMIDYPLKASVLFCLSPFDIAASLITYIVRRITPLPEISFEEAARNNFGDRLFELFFKNYINCFG